MVSNVPRIRAERESGWLAGAVVSGFIATMVMMLVFMVAFYTASAISESMQKGGTFAQWLWALTHNSLVTLAGRDFFAALGLHMAFGLIWAAIYAYGFEPFLPGTGWQKGALFSLVPWILSLVVFLPVVGAGFVGLGLGAGPLPIVGNLILHLVYGITLGALYAVGVDSWVLAEPPDHPSADREHAMAKRSEAGTAIGILAGTVVGAVIGWLISGVALAASGVQLSEFSLGAIVVLSAIVGAAGGALVGSMVGIGGRTVR